MSVRLGAAELSVDTPLAFGERLQTIFDDLPSGDGRPDVAVLVQHHGDTWSVESRGERTIHGSAETAMASVMRIGNRALLDHARSDHLHLHAGAVSLGGGAVVFAGEAQAGKTTLVAALVKSGCAYLSDETVALAPDLHALTAPKPLSLRPGGAALLDSQHESGKPLLRGRQLVPASSLGPVAESSRNPVRCFVILEPRDGPVPSRSTLSRCDAIVDLAGNAMDLPRSGQTGFASLVDAVAASSTWSLRPGALTETVELVHQLDDAGRSTPVTRLGPGHGIGNDLRIGERTVGYELDDGTVLFDDRTLQMASVHVPLSNSAAQLTPGTVEALTAHGLLTKGD